MNQFVSLRLMNEMQIFRRRTEHKSVPRAGMLIQALFLTVHSSFLHHLSGKETVTWIAYKYLNSSRNDQHYALICTTPLFYILAPTCFSSSLPSSESFLDSSVLPEIQIEWVVYHTMCGYVACVPECCGSTEPRHSGTHLIRYTTHSICISSNSEGSKQLPDDGRLLAKHVGASI
jgi:hypothetical protein